MVFMLFYSLSIDIDFEIYLRKNICLLTKLVLLKFLLQIFL